MISPPAKPSGEQPAVVAFHAKATEIKEHTVPLLVALNDRIDRARSTPPKSLEGEWVVVIRGAGQLPPDVRRLAGQMVQDLRLAGHVITQATILNGANIASGVEAAASDIAPIESAPDTPRSAR